MKTLLIRANMESLLPRKEVKELPTAAKVK